MYCLVSDLNPSRVSFAHARLHGQSTARVWLDFGELSPNSVHNSTELLNIFEPIILVSKPAVLCLYSHQQEMFATKGFE